LFLNPWVKICLLNLHDERQSKAILCFQLNIF